MLTRRDALVIVCAALACAPDARGPESLQEDNGGQSGVVGGARPAGRGGSGGGAGAGSGAGAQGPGGAGGIGRDAGEPGAPAADSGSARADDGGREPARADAAAGGDGNTGPASTNGRVPFVYVGGGFYSMPSAVYAFRFDAESGNLTAIGTPVTAPVAPTFLAVHPSRRLLYATIENVPGQVMALAIDPASGALNRINTAPAGGDGSTHISLDITGRWIFEAHYESGSATVVATDADGKVGRVVDTKLHAPSGVRAYSHSIRVDPSNKYVFVPNKGLSTVAQYRFDAATGKLTPNDPPTVSAPSGVGPRFVEVHPTGKWVYVVNEQGSSVTTYALDAATGRLTRGQTLSALPAGYTGSNSGAVAYVHPSGKFLYSSNRGHDSIAMFAVNEQDGTLTLLGHQPSRGKTPQSLGIDEAGRFLFVANKGSDALAVFKIDAASGRLTPFGPTTSVKTPSWVGIVYLP